MKFKTLIMLLGIAALTGSCRNEITPPETSVNSGSGGQCRITIIGEGDNSASRGSVHFEGGTASGAGLYHSDDTPVVSAEPSPGYEISHFFGGPQSAPRLYDYERTRKSSFEVRMSDGDHFFEVRFKEKKRFVTIAAGPGGSVTPSGTGEYRADTPHRITATPDKGYEFTGWSVKGDVRLSSSAAASTTFLVQDASASTITAHFRSRQSETTYTYTFMCGGAPGVSQRIYVNGSYAGSADNYRSVTVKVKKRDHITSTGETDPFNGWWTTKGAIQRISSSTNLSIYGGDFPDGMGFYAEYRD